MGLSHDLWGVPGMAYVDWEVVEHGLTHRHRFKMSRRESRTYGVQDSCWGLYYEVYIFECKDLFCPVVWPVEVEEFWHRKIFSPELPD